MQTIQAVTTRRQRVEQGVMIESLCQCQVAALAGQWIKVCQHFIHAAVLDLEHILKARLIDRARGIGNPVGETSEHHQRPITLRLGVGISKACQYLVQGVPRYTGDLFARKSGFELGGAIREGADQAVPPGLLTGGKLAYYVIDPRVDLTISRRCCCHRARAQVVPERMAMAPYLIPRFL